MTKTDAIEEILEEQGIATKEEIKERAKRIEERDRESMQSFLLTGQSQNEKIKTKKESSTFGGLNY